MSEIVRPVLTFFASFAITLLVLPVLVRMAGKTGLMDLPARRKVHRQPKPLVGGIGIVIALLISSALFIPASNLRGYFAGLAVLVIVGVVDDWKELGHRWKFVAQIGAAILMMAFSTNVLRGFGDLLSFGNMYLGALSVPMTLFCTVGIINALNMIDGLDGLAGGISLIIFISFAFLAHINQQADLMLLSLALAGATGGFLTHNWHPASMFLGDAGSLSLGFSLVFLSIALTQQPTGLVKPVAPLLLLAVPIVDTITVMARRMANGKSPFHADKTHLHHVFLRFGFSVSKTVKIILLMTASFAVSAAAGAMYDIPEHHLFSLFLAFFISYLFAATHVKEILRTKIWIEKKGLSSDLSNRLMVAIVQILHMAAKIRRKGRRFVLNMPIRCTLKSDGEASAAEMTDISLGGFSVSLCRPFNLGKELDAAFSLYVGELRLAFSSRVEFRWATAAEDGGYRQGVRFVGLRKQQRQVLRDFLNLSFAYLDQAAFRSFQPARVETHDRDDIF